MKYEKKITICFKYNCNYLNSKSAIRNSLNRHKSDGSETKSTLETTGVSVFQPTPFGPLSKDCYSKRSNILSEPNLIFTSFLENDFMVHPESVTKLLNE